MRLSRIGAARSGSPRPPRQRRWRAATVPAAPRTATAPTNGPPVSWPADAAHAARAGQRANARQGAYLTAPWAGAMPNGDHGLPFPAG